MLPRRLVRLAVLVAPVILLLPTASHAETVVTEDAVGDVQAFVFEQEAQFIPAPHEAAMDITRTVAVFGHQRLRVTVHFRNLTVRPRHATFVRVTTPRGSFGVGGERRSASRPRVAVTNGRGDAVDCRGLSVRYDGAADLVSFSVPTSCIRSPRWVRLGVRVRASAEADPENPSTVILLADDGHRDTYADTRIARGPRIHRG